MDFSLYFITAERNKEERSDVEVVAAAIRGGAGVVQLRKKKLSLREQLQLGEELRELTRWHNIPLIINDRLDLALALNADGVHLGEEDFPVSRARELLGGEKIIGKTARTVSQALAAEKEGADYLGVGAVYPTSTKTNTKLIGLPGLQGICSAVQVPVVAIGGITAENAASAVQKGADGVAVVSYLADAEDIAGRAAEIIKAVNKAAGRNEANE